MAHEIDVERVNDLVGACAVVPIDKRMVLLYEIVQELGFRIRIQTEMRSRRKFLIVDGAPLSEEETARRRRQQEKAGM